MPGLWARTYDFAQMSWGFGIAADGADNVAVAGFADDVAWGRKLDASGEELWAQTFEGEGEIYGCDGAATDIADNVLVVGRTHKGSDFDISVRRYAP